MPVEVIAVVHSEVLLTIHYFECVPVEFGFSLSLEVCVVIDSDDLALLWVELRLS